MDATKPSNDLQSLRLTQSIDSRKALDEYHRALGGDAHSTVSIEENANHKFGCTLSFTIEGERDMYIVHVPEVPDSDDFYTLVFKLDPRDAAHDIAARCALSIIDAIRVRNHAKAFISGCSFPYSRTDRSAFHWFTGYSTMRGEHLKWRNDSVMNLSVPDIVGIYFDYPCICDDGNYAYTKEDYVSSDGINNAEAENDAMFKAVRIIAGIVPPGFYTRIRPSRGHDANKLVELCAALDCQICFPFAVDQVWTGGKSETKVSVIIHNSSGTIAYTSPTVIVGTDEASVGAAKNKVARYALDWIAGLIFF